MTPLETQQARHALAEARLRLDELESSNRYLRARCTRLAGELDHQRQEARFLHGLLIAVGVEVRKKVAA